MIRNISYHKRLLFFSTFLLSLTFSFLHVGSIDALAASLSTDDIKAYNSSFLVGAYPTPMDDVGHFFSINSSPHRVTYRLEDPENDKCWKMTSSDYFKVNGDFFMCYNPNAGTGLDSTGFIYKKTKSDEAAISSNLTLVKDADIKNLERYQEDYIKVMQAGLTFAQSKDASDHLEATYFTGSYTVEIHDNDGGVSKPPHIHLIGTVKGHNDAPADRPDLEFILVNVKGWSGPSDNNTFYFAPVNPEKIDDILLSFLLSPHTSAGEPEQFFLKISQNGEGGFVYSYGKYQTQDEDLGANVTVKQAGWWDKIVNRVYNANGIDKDGDRTDSCGKITVYDGGKGVADPKYKDGLAPMTKCINTSEDGWLVKWLGRDWKFDAQTPLSGLNPPEDEYCPSASVFSVSSWFKSSLCGLGMAFHDAGQKLMDFAQKQLFIVLGYTSKNNNQKETGY